MCFCSYNKLFYITLIAQQIKTEHQYFKLVPQKGRFVMDFGGIYEITNENLDRLIPLKTRGNR